MLGDSITHFWEWHWKSWAKFTKDLTVFNFGYRGDATHNLIWRIEHGELDGFKARCIVLMIGTNNNWPESTNPVEVAEAIKKIVGMIRERQPQAKLVMHPIFPRGNAPGSPKDVSSSARNKKTNEIIEQFVKEDGKIVWIDFSDKLVDETGWVPKSIMPDGLHPSDAGYEIWMNALKPITDELRQNSKSENSK
jgi:beta-glucosidase